MGLDMYLRANKYVSGYEHRGEEAGAEYKGLVETFGMADFVDPESPSAEVEFTVAYWRKANQIHQWFVDNVQDGRDECQKAYVSREKLLELREICARIAALPTRKEAVSFSLITADGKLEDVTEKRPALTEKSAGIAETLLPTQAGFFFGSTEYGAWYLEDIELTVKQLDRVLELDDNVWTFYYQSSW